MNVQEFANFMERPIYSDLHELFENAKLSDKEIEIFMKYQKYCEYWLLRAKTQYVTNWEGQPNFIQLLSRVLINLQSDKVIGAKDTYIKEMFSDKKIHKVSKTKNGIRSTIYSEKVFNTYFELEVLSYFLELGYTVELCRSKGKGEKIPEFIVTKNGVRINVEAKKLKFTRLLDNIHGDGKVYDIGYRLTSKERDEGYYRIQQAFERNYKNAMSKYKLTPENEFFLLFFLTHQSMSYMGLPIKNYIANLPKEWNEKNYKRFLGIVIPFTHNTMLVKNETCKFDMEKNIPQLEQFHNYYPEII